jgi:hypothetical protein
VVVEALKTQRAFVSQPKHPQGYQTLLLRALAVLPMQWLGLGSAPASQGLACAVTNG